MILEPRQVPFPKNPFDVDAESVPSGFCFMKRTRNGNDSIYFKTDRIEFLIEQISGTWCNVLIAHAGDEDQINYLGSEVMLVSLERFYDAAKDSPIREWMLFHPEIFENVK